MSESRQNESAWARMQQQMIRDRDQQRAEAAQAQADQLRAPADKKAENREEAPARRRGTRP